jgi:peptide/nickel transport system substrate-binding protein
MDVVDTNTLRINLKEWDSSMLHNLAYNVRIVSPAAVTKNGKEWAMKNPVGTGPFKLVSWERDVSMKFKKNENYWQKGKPYLDGIEYTLISDRNTAANAFKSGAGHVLTLMNPETFIELEKSGKYVMRANDGIFGALGMSLMFDSANPDSPFKDVKVRQAVIHAVDTEAIGKSVLNGFGTPLTQWNIPSTWSYNPDVKGFPYNPEKAKQLLTEAGYPNGFKTKITTDPTRVTLMTAVQSYLAKVGIDAQIVTVDVAKWSATVADKWEGMIWAPLPLGTNTTDLMKGVFGKNAALYSKSIAHPEKIDKILDNAVSAPDFETSKKFVQELQKAVFEEYTLNFPMLRLRAGIAMQPNVQDFGMWKTNGLDWNPESVWLKK